MTQRAALVVLLTVLLSVATGCGGDRGKPLDFAPAPWRDGESAIYDVYDKTRKRRGSKTFTWRREGNATWRLEQNDDSGRSRVHLVDDSLAPLESREERDGETVVVHFGSDTISIERGGDTKQVERPYDAIDGDQFYQLFRALPFAEGYERQLSFVDTTTGESPRMTVSVEAAEQVRVPAGDIRAWRVVVDTGAGGVRELLYGAEPPHPFVRYRWPMVSESVLRSYVPEEGAARVGPEAPGDERAGEPDKPLPINWPLVILQVCVSLPLMMLFPVILGWRLLRRLRVSFRIWALGAGCYVVSQVVHLPLNWLLGLSGSSGPLSGAPLWVVGLSVGLSAALCEELARYAFMRGWLAKRGELGWHRGVVFGAGHGGIEAMILGAMVGMGVVNLVAATFMADAQTRELLQSEARAARADQQTLRSQLEDARNKVPSSIQCRLPSNHLESMVVCAPLQKRVFFLCVCVRE